MNSPDQNNQKSTNKWGELHEHLQGQLAGYADNELDIQQLHIVEAHLAGCEACRNDLARQQTLSHRLENIPPARMPSALQHRIDKMIQEASPEKSRTPQPLSWPFPVLLNRWMHNFKRPSILGASGWGVALVLSIVMLLPSMKPVQKSNIPMIQDALLEYNRMKSKSFPVTNSTTPLKAPANWPNAHVLATWTTNLAGSTAQVFAIRSGHHIIFQYQIDEAIFFRNPQVRRAIATSGTYKQRNNKTEVLALPLKHSGILVVGPAKSLPTPEKIKF